MARPMRTSAGKTVVGLDIEPGYVAAVEARARAGWPSSGAATAQLAPGVVRDGEVADVDAWLGAAHSVRRAQARATRPSRCWPTSGSSCACSTCRRSRIRRKLPRPWRFQAQDHIPMPLYRRRSSTSRWGSWRPRRARGPGSSCCRRDMIDRLVEATKRAGLRPHGIDLSAFAMIRACTRRAAPIRPSTSTSAA